MPMILLLALCQDGTAPVDWPALVQKPYQGLAVKDLGLRPLLATADGMKVNRKEQWSKVRTELEHTWQARLGPAPVKPEKLDVRIEMTEHLDGYSRQLVSFLSEGDDRTRAYLLVPTGRKENEKRPAVVVFHPTTKDTLNEPVGLGKRPEMALALQLVQRGYVTLSPECYIMKGDGPRAQAAALAKRRPGWTGLGKMTFDASRCVDFLE